MNGLDVVLKGILFIIGFGSILFLCYITTRYIGGRSVRMMKGRYIDIVETVTLGMDKRLHLVKAGSQFILIASCGKSVEFIAKIELDDYENVQTNESTPVISFKNLFEKYISAYRNKAGVDKRPGNDGKTSNKAESNHIRNNLHKLKEINKRMSSHDVNDGDGKTNEG